MPAVTRGTALVKARVRGMVVWAGTAVALATAVVRATGTAGWAAGAVEARATTAAVWAVTAATPGAL